MMNVKKIISLIMLLFMLLPLGAQNSEGVFTTSYYSIICK